jgi:NTP pyrophosphatase (non-canonical NTP hydrolase)
VQVNDIEIRPKVMAFARLMEVALRKNDHKGGWKECSEAYLFTRLIEEAGELGKAMLSFLEGSVGNEAVDVANFAMMLADKYGDLEVKP